MKAVSSRSTFEDFPPKSGLREQPVARDHRDGDLSRVHLIIGGDPIKNRNHRIGGIGIASSAKVDMNVLRSNHLREDGDPLVVGPRRDSARIAERDEDVRKRIPGRIVKHLNLQAPIDRPPGGPPQLEASNGWSLRCSPPLQERRKIIRSPTDQPREFQSRCPFRFTFFLVKKATGCRMSPATLYIRSKSSPSRPSQRFGVLWEFRVASTDWPTKSPADRAEAPAPIPPSPLH